MLVASDCQLTREMQEEQAAHLDKHMSCELPKSMQRARSRVQLFKVRKERSIGSPIKGKVFKTIRESCQVMKPRTYHETTEPWLVFPYLDYISY